ncbi:Na+/proline symporter [Marinilabilia salmonicolor]|jgi:Na+/proline symporter|uniref:sodium:solute symporter family protein n=1 Tax=Marinilabilia salmonicolor TaxID=989 RepID=UPI000D0747E3|nr:sodium:solute symporter family protein [Marinilabilia salmonicolor]PRZ01603.1 Na+/proline symporter [Marinilabilia salmonicolor]
MNLSLIDISILLGYLVLTLFIGFWLSKRASKDLEAYFLGGNKIKWYYLGLSNASGMFDISGTMWTVAIVFVYGLKSAWIPWLWPVWNQIFVMVFLAVWMRRSNTMTGAQWITFRFGDGRGGRLSHIIVVLFAVVSVIGFIAYFVEGIGKFATTFFSWDLSASILGLQLTSQQVYALIIIAITTIYTMKGGMYSVVSTEVLQFLIMTVACVSIGVIAFNEVTPDQIAAATPEGWANLWPEWNLSLDWSGIFPELNDKIDQDGYEMFGMLLLMMILKGVFASLAGPVPSYDMQRILSTRTPAEAAKMSGLTSLVLFIPRYLMIGGLAVLGLVYLKPELMKMGADLDFEMVLPMAIQEFIPVGIKGLLLAGLLAAFMGTFAAFINAAPAYLINDLYKKYLNPGASDKKLVRYSYMSSLLLVIIGLIFGLFAQSLNSLTLWITSSLYGGYAAANVLKWIWWRFNGMGYFYGMLGGLVASVVVPPIYRIIVPGTIDIYMFPVTLLISMSASVLGTLLTKPEKMDVLKKFYKQTRPWGFWEPVKKEVIKDDPSFMPNKDFKRDSFNVLIGITWQMSMVVLPLYFLSGEYAAAWISLAILVGTSAILKFTWYDHIKNID